MLGQRQSAGVQYFAHQKWPNGAFVQHFSGEVPLIAARLPFHQRQPGNPVGLQTVRRLYIRKRLTLKHESILSEYQHVLNPS